MLTSDRRGVAAMAAAVDSDVADDVGMTSSLTDMDVLAGSSTRKLVTETDGDEADRQNDSSTQQAVNDSCHVSPMISVASLLSRRNKTPVTPTDSSPAVVTLHDVRKFVFQATARSDKRIMAGLRAHTFTSQTFISSFAVGLAIGSILAIIIKLLTEVGYRVLPF